MPAARRASDRPARRGRSCRSARTGAARATTGGGLRSARSAICASQARRSRRDRHGATKGKRRTPQLPMPPVSRIRAPRRRARSPAPPACSGRPPSCSTRPAARRSGEAMALRARTSTRRAGLARFGPEREDDDLACAAAQRPQADRRGGRRAGSATACPCGARRRSAAAIQAARSASPSTVAAALPLSGDAIAARGFEIGRIERSTASKLSGARAGGGGGCRPTNTRARPPSRSARTFSRARAAAIAASRSRPVRSTCGRRPRRTAWRRPRRSRDRSPCPADPPARGRQQDRIDRGTIAARRLAELDADRRAAHPCVTLRRWPRQSSGRPSVARHVRSEPVCSG